MLLNKANFTIEKSGAIEESEFKSSPSGNTVYTYHNVDLYIFRYLRDIVNRIRRLI